MITSLCITRVKCCFSKKIKYKSSWVNFFQFSKFAYTQLEFGYLSIYENSYQKALFFNSQSPYESYKKETDFYYQFRLNFFT